MHAFSIFKSVSGGVELHRNLVDNKLKLKIQKMLIIIMVFNGIDHTMIESLLLLVNI